MGIISKLFGLKKASDSDLSRPDFEHAGVEEFALDQSTLLIKDPQQTAQIPLTNSVNTLGLYNESLFSKERHGNFAKSIYKRGWTSLGDGNEPRGGVIANLVVLYDPESYIANKNNFSLEDLNMVALEHCHIMWGCENDAKNIGDIGTGTLIYPTKTEQLQHEMYNGVNYVKTETRYKNDPPEINYFTALTSRHTLIITFKLETFKGKDYYPLDFESPETNIKEVCFWTVEQFMSNIKLKLSDEALKQKAEAV